MAIRKSAPPTVSGRWILKAVAIAIALATACCWAVLCLLFWQGSWQLLYHPTSGIAQTPDKASLPFVSIDFAADTAGSPQLHGWWIPGNPDSHFTAIFLHGADGNLADTLPTLTNLHNAHLNVFAFDYRGYGQSRFVRPSEARFQQDAESAIDYLINTRHIPAGSIILVGQGLGAILAVEAANFHPEFAGVVVDRPIAAPEDIVFNDPRARLVPARLLVSDRWQISRFDAGLRIPSLWFTTESANKTGDDPYLRVMARHQRVWLPASSEANNDFGPALTRWLDDLRPAH